MVKEVLRNTGEVCKMLQRSPHVCQQVVFSILLSTISLALQLLLTSGDPLTMRRGGNALRHELKSNSRSEKKKKKKQKPET